MAIGIENTLALSNAQNKGLLSVQSKGFGSYKTNPIKPDAFQKRVQVGPQENALNQLYQKILAEVAPYALLDKYLDEKSVAKMIQNNPEVLNILNNNGVPLEICTDNVKDIKNVHLNTTKNYANGIAKQLNLSNSDINTINKGAIFHDYGKILIPASLLNKTTKLTPEEKKIVDLHSKLGYELLKNSPLDENTLQMVKDHHKGFNKNPNLNTQILSVADIHSALTTKRSYKEPLTNEQSIAILNKYAEMGHVNPQIITALQNYLVTENVAA